jgi:ribosome-binding factor A
VDLNLDNTKSFGRKERIASKVQTLVAEILRDNFMDDPIISGVSLVGSESHGGLNYVKLFYYTRSDDRKSVQKRLDEINKMVRFELANRMDQKYVPELRFAYDDTLEKAQRIDQLLESIGK